MNKYELVVILDAALSQEQKENIMKEVGDALTKQEAKIINRQVWLEKHRIAFKLKGKVEGTYYIVNYESPAAAAVKIREALRFNEKILRFLIVNAE